VGKVLSLLCTSYNTYNITELLTSTKGSYARGFEVSKGDQWKSIFKIKSIYNVKISDIHFMQLKTSL
jgi:hypothetical protein